MYILIQLKSTKNIQKLNYGFGAMHEKDIISWFSNDFIAICDVIGTWLVTPFGTSSSTAEKKSDKIKRPLVELNLDKR